MGRLINEDKRDQLEMILRYQPDVLRAVREDGAARLGKTEMVAWLISQGADVAAPANSSSARPVEWARKRGFLEIEKILSL